MKKIIAIPLIMIFVLSACSPSNRPAPSETASAAIPSPALSTPTATERPAAAALTPAPSLSLPVSLLTPVPSSGSRITAENVNDLQEIARYYGEINYFAKLTKDKKFLFMLDPDGLTKYDYKSMEILAYIPVANSVSDLQISNDGGLLILDNNWLLDFKNDNEPKLHLLSEKIHLLNFYSRDFALSPDGTMIAVEQMDCRNLCEHIFRLVSTEDFSELFTSSAQTHQSLPTFSPDGKYFALADLFIEDHPDGSTNPAGASVSIWTTSDVTKLSTFDDIKFPFNVTGIAFSKDNTLLAIAQRTSIDIYDIVSGETKATLNNLCDSYERKVMFAPTPPLRILENSDCSSGVWLISANGPVLSVLYGYAPNLSKVVFDENGDSKAIPYTQPTNPNVGAYYYEDYFVFLNDDVLSFKYRDAETSDSHSCDLSLASGSFDCQAHAYEYNNKQYLGKDVLLATDGKYYSYVVGKSRVDIYTFEDPSQVYYSIPFQDYIFDVLALDPINNLIFYNVAINSGYSKVIIQDMTSDRILEKWEGQTFISDLVISENSRYAALCRTIGYYNDGTDKDRLVIFDLSEKRIVYDTAFNCNGTALALSRNGATLVSEKGEGATAATAITRVMIVDTLLPYETKYLDFDSWFSPYALAFSPDGTTLAANCSNNEICFLDPSDGREIHRLQAHSGISNMAFSKDGSVLATSSDWGLISLWAVPPFTGNARPLQSSPISSYTPGFSWNFDEEGNFEGWAEQDWHSVDVENLRVEEGSLSATAAGAGPILYSREALGIDTTRFSQIEIRMRVSSGEYAQLYFRYGNNDMSEELSQIFEIQPGTEFQTYIIDMSNVLGWKGIIDQLRLDPTRDATGATIDIDYIHLLP